MAVRGAKPRATVVKLLTGTARTGRVRPDEPMPSGRPLPPVPLHGRPLALWRRFITRAWWLTAADSQKAFMWAHMAAEFEAGPQAMTAARIAQLRALGSELGLDPASRSRLGAAGDKPRADPLARYRGG